MAFQGVLMIWMSWVGILMRLNMGCVLCSTTVYVVFEQKSKNYAQTHNKKYLDIFLQLSLYQMSLCTSNPHSTTCIYKVLSILSVVICCYRIFGNYIAQTTQHTRICSPLWNPKAYFGGELQCSICQWNNHQSGIGTTHHCPKCWLSVSNEQLDILKQQIEIHCITVNMIHMVFGFMHQQLPRLNKTTGPHGYQNTFINMLVY